MKTFLKVLFLLILFSKLNYSWDYGEHKKIGDMAFKKVINELIVSGFFKDSIDAVNFLNDFIGMKYNSEIGNYYLSELSHSGNIITYGTLNALSGDHEDNPLDIDEFLRHRTSVLNRIVNLQEKYAKLFMTGAPDMEVADIDFSYVLLALYDLSHFYNYGVSLQDQIEEFDKDLILKSSDPSYIDDLLDVLKHSNSINKYISIHTIAINLAETAGRQLKINPKKSKVLMYYAILFNSFADHFLEDHFPSGHQIVNRSIFSGIINNKALHDFYNTNGLNVANLNGETWKQYGDGTFDNRFSAWKSKKMFEDIEYPEYSKETNRVFTALSKSIEEIFYAFKESSRNMNHEKFYSKIPDDKSLLPSFFISEFKALSYTPIPFNTDISEFNIPSENIEEVKNNTYLLPHRDFIKSRVANSIILALMADNYSSVSDSWLTAEMRMVFGAKYYSYNYNLDQTKSWTIDKWFGTTISYGMGWRPGDRLLAFNDLQVGLSYNFDFWVSDSRFIGLYGFIETGWMRLYGIDRAMFSPSVGLQLGSLIGLKFYEWPAWVRIPVQFLLPLKLRYSYSFIAGGKTKEQFVIELDLAF